MPMFERLTKTVRVSDPERWYGQNTVQVSLYVTPAYKGEYHVKILVDSIDDFMMEHIKPAYNDLQIADLYARAKQYMYDKMPDIINVEWLFEHGYDIF